MFQKIFLFLLLVGHLYASHSEVLISDTKVFNDKNATLQFSDILNQKFEQQTKPNFALGYKKGDLWLQLQVENKSEEEELVLSLGESFYEKADLYYFDQKGQLVKKENSLFTPIKTREIATNKLAFAVVMQKNSNNTFYLKLHGKYAYFGHITIETKKSFYAQSLFSINAVYLVIFGILFAIIIFNVFLYIYVRERIYLYYIGYGVFNFIYMANISGLLVFFDLQKYIYDLQLSAAFMIGFLTLFSFEYLNTKKYMKKYDRLLKSLSIPFFIFGILVVFSYQPWNKFINNFAGLICIVLIIISTIIYFKGHTKTKYYIFAMVLYFTFVILFTFMVVGVLEYNDLTRYGFIVASVIETIIFSLILSNRYHRLKEENERFLEDAVKQRTQEIEELLEEKELLLKEIHHRVKNNFHMISGLFWFEGQKDPTNSENFQNIKNRIKSMSMIHERLYRSENIANISIKEYLEEIINNLLASYSSFSIKLLKNIEELVLNFEHALALGIILNEVVSNSIKHNKDRNSLSLHIVLEKKGDLVALTITDDGKGFNSQHESDGIGMNLIESFAKSLPESTYTVSSNNGVQFSLNFTLTEVQTDEQ